MKRQIYLLIAIIALYLISSLALHLIYGESYEFLQGEDAWMPDGNSGWVRHGNPSDPMPTEPSVNVPEMVRYIPIFVPTLLLALFLFTPLSRKLEGKRTSVDEIDKSSDSVVSDDDSTSRSGPGQ